MRLCFPDENKLRNVFVSVRDITHFRTADEIKATFISIVSHELRTPVTLIKGYASTLRRDDAKWDKAHHQRLPGRHRRGSGSSYQR